MSHQSYPGPVAVVLGTRPEIIKMARIVELLGPDAHLVHTGQHYDPTLAENFFGEFGMRLPDTRLEVGGQTRGAQIGSATVSLDGLFESIRPVAVVVQGDTNAVAAGSIAANARNIPLVHVEAGLRSYDRAMPEEHNRVISDHLSDLCLAPTQTNVDQLADEGIVGSRVELTGNPVVEAVDRLMPTEDEQDRILEARGVAAEQYGLATFHRPENVDQEAPLRAILEALAELDEPVIVPLHPRTVQRVRDFGLDGVMRHLNIIEPIGYTEFLALGANARLILSDSGGVQEEVSVYKRPAVIIRRSTERPEVDGTFTVRVLPDDSLNRRIQEAWRSAPERAASLRDVPSPYGDADSPERCVAAIRRLVESVDR